MKNRCAKSLQESPEFGRFYVADIGIEDSKHQHSPAQVGNTHLDSGRVGAESRRGCPWSEVALDHFDRRVDDEFDVVAGVEN